MQTKSKTSIIPILFTGFLVLAGLTFLISFTLSGTAKTLPKITLSYFKDKIEFAAAVDQITHQQLIKEKIFWIGLEPEKDNHIALAVAIKNSIEQNFGKFDAVLLDKELGLDPAKVSSFGPLETVSLKDNLLGLVDFVVKDPAKKILIITAAVYSTNLILDNPLQIFEKASNIKPTTFSMGYFPMNSEDEANNVFRCVTEDNTGTGSWGCAVINKARSVRRKINIGKLLEHPAKTLGLMDATGEKNYMILLGKDPILEPITEPTN